MTSFTCPALIGRSVLFRCMTHGRCAAVNIRMPSPNSEVTTLPQGLAQSLCRYTKGPGEGEGKGGGGGGVIRSAGGAFGKREATDEERHFREEQARQIENLKKHLMVEHEARIEYHTRQLQRHLDSIKEQEELQKTDKHPKQRDVHIKSHKESAKAHQEMLDSLKKRKF